MRRTREEKEEEEGGGEEEEEEEGVGGARLVMGHSCNCVDKVIFSVYRYLSKRIAAPGRLDPLESGFQCLKPISEPAVNPLHDGWSEIIHFQCPGGLGPVHSIPTPDTQQRRRCLVGKGRHRRWCTTGEPPGRKATVLNPISPGVCHPISHIWCRCIRGSCDFGVPRGRPLFLLFNQSTDVYLFF
jgi:hypothetical protein